MKKKRSKKKLLKRELQRVENEFDDVKRQYNELRAFIADIIDTLVVQYRIRIKPSYDITVNGYGNGLDIKPGTELGHLAINGENCFVGSEFDNETGISFANKDPSSG